MSITRKLHAQKIACKVETGSWVTTDQQNSIPNYVCTMSILIIIKFNKSGRRIGTMYIRWRMSQGPVATGPVWQPQAWGLPKIEGNPPN